MNDKFFKELGKTASDAFLNDGTSLNESVVKLAKKHNLNADQVYRVSEAANLTTYLTKMKTAGAKERTFEFDLAKPETILPELNMKAPEVPTKEASDKAIKYFVKSASINKASIIAPEYDVDGSFLNDLITETEELSVKVANATPSIFEEHNKILYSRQKARNKISHKEKIAELESELMINQIKLANDFKSAVLLVKKASLSKSNPFLIWNEYGSDLKGQVADKVFTKAAEDLTRYNAKLATELLSEVKVNKSKKIDDRTVAIAERNPIIKHIDNITNFKKIIDKIEDFRSEGGLLETSSTPTNNVAYSIDNGADAVKELQKAEDFSQDKLKNKNKE